MACAGNSSMRRHREVDHGVIRSSNLVQLASSGSMNILVLQIKVDGPWRMTFKVDAWLQHAHGPTFMSI